MEKRGGSRRKSRHIFRKNKGVKGRLPITKYLQQFAVGDRVILSAEPAYQKSLYHHRFHGHSGIVKGMVGKCYTVEIYDHDKAKSLYVHPVHLKRQNQEK